jgi:hypothetical protein
MQKKVSPETTTVNDNIADDEAATGGGASTPAKEPSVAGSTDDSPREEKDSGPPSEPPPDKPPSGGAPGRRFDPSRVRLSQDFAAMTSVKTHVLVVPIRKPTKHEWVQFHPDEAWRIQVAVIVYKDERESYYVVDSALWPNLTAEIVPILLVATVSTQGAFFLTPIRLPGPDGRHNDWHRSLLDAVALGQKGDWIRVMANMSVGGYAAQSATGDLGPAAWPALTFVELLEIALRDHLIDTFDHPILKRLRGES